MAKNITATLPPKHGGYRAVQSPTSKSAKTARDAPPPPPGEGGGSKGTK